MPDELRDETREKVTLLGGEGHDGERRLVDPDVLGLVLAGFDGLPATYLRTTVHDSEEFAVFVHADIVERRALDHRLRKDT